MRVLFTRLGVADTLEGRFEMVALHAGLVMRRLSALGDNGNDLAQIYVDRIFTGFDDALREMAIGDVGVDQKDEALCRGVLRPPDGVRFRAAKLGRRSLWPRRWRATSMPKLRLRAPLRPWPLPIRAQRRPGDASGHASTISPQGRFVFPQGRFMEHRTMKELSPAPLSRLIRVDPLPRDGIDVNVVADADELARIAEFNDLVDVKSSQRDAASGPARQRARRRDRTAERQRHAKLRGDAGADSRRDRRCRSKRSSRPARRSAETATPAMRTRRSRS